MGMVCLGNVTEERANKRPAGEEGGERVEGKRWFLTLGALGRIDVRVCVPCFPCPSFHPWLRRRELHHALRPSVGCASMHRHCAWRPPQGGFLISPFSSCLRVFFMWVQKLKKKQFLCAHLFSRNSHISAVYIPYGTYQWWWGRGFATHIGLHRLGGGAIHAEGGEGNTYAKGGKLGGGGGRGV